MEAPEKKRDERGRSIAHTRQSPDKNTRTKEENGRTKIADREQRNGREFRRRRLVGMYVVSGVVYGIVEVRSVGRI